MIYLRFYLHSKVTEKGTQSLYIDVRCDGLARLRQATGEVLKASQWNAKREQVTTKHEYADILNARIDRIKVQVQIQFRGMLENGTLPTGEDLRMILRPLREQKKTESGPPKVRTLYEQWKTEYLTRKNRGTDVPRYIEAGRESKLIGYNYVRGFVQVIASIEDFKPTATAHDLTAKSWDAYLNHLHEKGKEDSTISNHVKGWKLLRGLAGLSTTEAWLRNTFGGEKIQHDLTWQEVKTLHEFNYSKPEYREIVDAFTVACQLGLRKGDMSSVKKLNFEEHKTCFGLALCIRKRQGKTGQPVVVPFPPLAKSIFDAYEGIPEIKGRYNKLLKEAAKEAGLKRLVVVESIKNNVVTETQLPLHEVISLHTARHTAASRVREASDYETAQLVLGHATSGNTGRYAHLEPVKTAEKILKAWAYYK